MLHSKNEELIIEIEKKINEYGVKINDCENEIRELIEDNVDVDIMFAKIDELIHILKDTRYDYNSMTNKFELYNKGRLMNLIREDSSLSCFMASIELAPKDTQIIEGVDIYIFNNVTRNKGDKVYRDRILYHENEGRNYNYNSLSLEGKMEESWKNKRNELFGLLVEWERFKNFPETIRYLDSI